MKFYKKTAVKFAASAFSLIVISSCAKHFDVKHSEYKQYAMDSQLNADSSMLRYYAPYKQKMEAEMNRVIGFTTAEITKSSAPESLLGDFYADAVLAESRKIDPSIQFAFPTTKGGIRTSVPKGDITITHVFELMPFENEVVILKLSGQNMKILIDYLATSSGQPVSGLRMKIKNKEPYDVTIDGKPFDVSQTYTMVTSDYIANNGDEQKSLANPLERKNAGKKIRDVLIDYISEQTKNGRKITPQLDGRIVVTND
ncbi:5'-nucleotidase C-terminal domain-containing protein [Dyadobacter psychrotolerans]|uniref:5'-Nucleotidase C-terminal domain-containing protein n=1 Tax=Dyadobacter psychrotolerans TaxID=2541721 RepID=A0A4R5DMR8_9BACT|nr:5'-nucleotidase [Dyadobacter psychrotolerans]TDE15449.1 hypothetical protein E0F88_13130 [Dyadobacter psychrotolerans]